MYGILCKKGLLDFLKCSNGGIVQCSGVLLAMLLLDDGQQLEEPRTG